jgi:hypothetical protein
MSFLITLVTADDLDNVVSVMNDSSAGLSFQFGIDPIQFLSLSNFWNLSYKHSYIGYVDSHPAGVVLNSVDTSTRDAYSFYWGVRPQFRNTTLSLKLLMTYFDQLAREGFQYTYGDTSFDSPSSIYLRLGGQFGEETLQMECLAPRICEVRNADERESETISLEGFLAAPDCSRTVPPSWIHRPETIRRASAFLRFVKCSNIYAAYQPHSAGSVVIDLKSQEPTKCTLAALLQHVAGTSAGRQCKLGYVPATGPLPDLLTELGFTVTKRSTSIALDLDHWRTRRKMASSR